MKSSVFTTLMLVFGLSFLSTPNLKAQVVVTDPRLLSEQIKEWADHIANLKQQLDQQIAQVQAMTGSRGMQGLIPSGFDELMSNLPEDWKHVYSDGMNSASNYASAAQSLQNAFQNQVGNMDRMEALNFVRQQRMQKGFYDRAMVERVYNNAMLEMSQLMELNNQIDSTKDVKAATDLQNRIQTQIGAIKAESEKLQLMLMLQQSQDKILEAQQRYAQHQALWGNSSLDYESPNRIPDYKTPSLKNAFSFNRSLD